ncbi:MAG: hypothetical protein IKY75_05495 [Bacteroidaceae bacterium]|nr:hypothetical protein [Bacteroidaceae bacterium]
MRKLLAITALILTTTITISGQGVVDALNNISSQTKGTARYSAMAGAFGALGGDLTSIRQNPAGIGVYRSSEISVTAGFNFYDNRTSSPMYDNRNSDFYFTGDNMGVVGTINFKEGALRNLNFGFAYNNVASYNNVYRADWDNISSSLTQLIASKTSSLNCPPGDLGITSSYNPYNNMPWLSVLGYNTNLIHQAQGVGSQNMYLPIFDSKQSHGNAYLINVTSGDVEEYDFNVSGNIYDVFYWGLSVNVTNIYYHQESYYGEELQDITVSNNHENRTKTSLTNGNFELSNYLLTKGLGAGAKLGFIYRPVNFLRIGAAVHTPTFYDMSDVYSAAVGYKFDKVDGQTLVGSENSIDNQTDIGQIDYQFTSPWHVMGSLAIIFNKWGIISADYEYTFANEMYYSDLYSDYSYVNRCINNEVSGVHNVRIGAEWRITPLFSARAGYAYESSPLDNNYFTGASTPLLAEGTICHYQVPGDVHNITCGLGYRFNNFSIDAAYVFRTQDYSIFAFEGMATGRENTILNMNNHSIKVTLGLRF